MEKIFFIAEAGVNHNGDINIAKRMIDVAKDAGADAVKFQTFHAESLASIYAKKAEYQLETTDKKESQQQMLKKLEISYEMHLELMEHCKKRHITFLSTPFDIDSICLLERIGIPMYKIPSGEVTNLPYLRKIASLHLPVIMSTGMCNINEVKEAVKILKENGAKEVSVLHCNTQYPTPIEDVNLNAMISMREELGIPVGYSDHTEGIEIGIAAAALGAQIIEKHFTLDKEMEGPDHKASLEPDELTAMIRAIRNVEIALGTKNKLPSKSEYANINIVRKSIVAKKTILKGESFTEENVTTKRPGNGISPMKWDDVIGQKAKRNFDEDELIEI